MKASILLLSLISSSAMAQSCVDVQEGKTPRGQSITICKETYRSSPFVHLPKDVVSAETSTLYLAIENGSFVDRNLTTYKIIDKRNRSSVKDFPIDTSSNRNLFTVYKVKGKIRTSTGSDGKTMSSLAVAGYQPFLQIDGCAIDGLLLGSWEGAVSARISTSDEDFLVFDASKALEFKVTFSSLRKTENLQDWDHKGQEIGGTAYQVQGEITNFQNLVDLGEANPFWTAPSAAVSLYRYPGMHAQGDNELVMNWPKAPRVSSSGMTPILPVSPKLLIAEKIPNQMLNLDFMEHGTPTGFKMTLSPKNFGAVKPDCSQEN
jgi:hypothetical protein